MTAKKTEKTVLTAYEMVKETMGRFGKTAPNEAMIASIQSKYGFIMPPEAFAMYKQQVIKERTLESIDKEKKQRENNTVVEKPAPIQKIEWMPMKSAEETTEKKEDQQPKEKFTVSQLVELRKKITDSALFANTLTQVFDIADIVGGMDNLREALSILRDLEFPK